MKTKKAIYNCANWLAYCLSIGWSKNDIDGLENLWWQYHDDQGNLVFNK